MGRSTYYRNFDSKIDILRYKEHVLRARWMEKANYGPDVEYWKLVSDLCLYFYDNRQQLSFLYDSDQIQLLCQMLYEVMGPKENDDRETALKKAHLSFGTFGILYQWVKNGMQESPEEISSFIQADCAHHGFL